MNNAVTLDALHIGILFVALILVSVAIAVAMVCYVKAASANDNRRAMLETTSRNSAYIAYAIHRALGTQSELLHQGFAIKTNSDKAHGFDLEYLNDKSVPRITVHVDLTKNVGHLTYLENGITSAYNLVQLHEVTTLLRKHIDTQIIVNRAKKVVLQFPESQTATR